MDTPTHLYAAYLPRFCGVALHTQVREATSVERKHHCAQATASSSPPARPAQP